MFRVKYGGPKLLDRSVSVLAGLLRVSAFGARLDHCGIQLLNIERNIGQPGGRINLENKLKLNLLRVSSKMY